MFYAFDLPTFAGEDLKRRPLDERRKTLRKLTRQLGDTIRFSETFDSLACRHDRGCARAGLEGVVAKRRDSSYEPGKRSGAWVKLRVNRRQDFVVGGYVPRGANFDSILVGYYEGDELKYAASVRAGFTPHRGRGFLRFSKLETAECPFFNLPEPRKAVGVRESRPRRWRYAVGSSRASWSLSIS